MPASEDNIDNSSKLNALITTLRTHPSDSAEWNKAFEAFFTEVRPPLIAYLMRQFNMSWAHAEQMSWDLLVEVSLAGFDQYDETRGHVVGWLKTCIHNRFLNQTRGPRRQAVARAEPLSDLIEKGQEPGVTSDMDSGIGREEFQTILEAVSLSAREELCLKLTYDNHEPREIAELLALKPHQVRKALSRGRRKVQAYLKGRQGPPLW